MIGLRGSDWPVVMLTTGAGLLILGGVMVTVGVWVRVGSKGEHRISERGGGGGGVCVTVNYYNMAQSSACLQRFSLLIKFGDWGVLTPKTPPPWICPWREWGL